MEDKDFEIEQESLDMNNLALSNATKYLATYKNPKEWILDEKEAKAARVFKSVAPEKSSKVGSLAYSAGELLRTTYAAPRQFVGSVSLLSAALKDKFYPNAEESALERWANNYGKLEAQREQTSQELISQEVGDQDWYVVGAAASQLIRDIALTGGMAKLGAKIAAKTAEKKVAGRLVGEDVAQRYVRQMAGKGATKAGGAAITGSVFAQEVGSRTVDDINQYIAKTGDADLKYYDPSVDLAVNIGVGALSAQIEKGLGVERFVPRLIARGAGEKIPGLTQILARGAEGLVGESLEEGAQETAAQIGDMIKSYRDWWDFDTDQILTSMVIGGVLGGTAGSGLYYINRRTAINRLVNEGMDKNLAADLVDTIASNEINKTINNLSASTELNTRNGQAYDKLKAGIKNALELQGWSEKMIDPKTGAELSLDEYVDLTVNSQLINRAVREAIGSGITIDEFLDVAQFTAVDNFMVLRPLGTAEEIKARIDEQKAIIARQQDLKKTGAGDDTVLREAKIKKAILEKIRLNKIVNSEIQRVNVEEAKTPENVQEIETANKDVESLNNAPTASEFNAGLDNNLTTAQKTKRLGNAVLKKIFGRDNLGFDSVITLPEYANARTVLTNSAERIINFAKKHRTYGIQSDLRNALKAMQTVNQGNFLEHATTPSLDGTDVIAQNAFLYHFLFKDADTTTAFIDAYLERAEASLAGETDSKLTKKDLVGQAFKATDNLMQVQAESAGIEYDSIFNEDGSYKDQNVAAVMMSYQNQFADDSQAQVAEEQKEIDAVAEQVVDGTATTGTPESVSENFIQDYGEKIEGAKKDMVPKTEQEKTENAVVNLLKRSKFNEVEIFEFNKWAQEQPYELLEKLLASKVTLYAAVSLDARRFIRDNDLYELSGEERQKQLRDAGIRLFDFYFKKPKGRLGELTVEALDAYVNARKQIQFTYQASTRGKLFLWGKKGNGSWLPLIEFATKEEMQAHKDSHSQEDLEKLYTEMTSYKQGERKVIRPRTGVDYRNGKNVTEKEFAEQFGFRGVQFGNYENQQKRQREINNSYDSFMDLAALLNVPPKALSLGGTLGIAFGARGSGSAAAHYEPDLKVINITRDSGAGALAHEWFHALDNYLAQNITNASKGDFLTNVRKRRVYTKNLELNDALADYMWEIGRQKDFQARLRLLGQYWKRDWEVAARIFEQYISAKIAEQNGINDYLASPQDYYLAETPYLKEDEAKNVFPYIEKIVKALKVEEREDGNVVLYQPEQFDLADENARLDDIYPAYEGDTIEVDGKERTVYNSNGDRIAKSKEALTNFWRWFSDSKVVDGQGRPLVVYHGTNAKFNTFDPEMIGKWDYGFYGKGFYFTDHKYVAEDYAKSGAFDDGGEAVVMPVYLNLKNPFFMEYSNDNGISDEKHARLKEQGYDGVIAVESRDLRKDGYEEELNKVKSLSVEHWKLKDYEGNIVGRVLPYEYVAWEGTQIKSVDNRGTYSEKTGNILYQTGYASMRGELIGDALDADLAYGFGEGTDVWFWGNYLLADKELDKRYYYDRFSRGTPDLKYENKVLDKRTLNSLGVTFPETQNLLINRLPDLSLTKDWFIKTLKTYLKNSEALYASHIDDVVKLYDFEQILEDEKFTEEEIRQTIKDIEKISLGAGATTGALFGFPESTEEGKIQAKYLKDPRKKELFKEVYEKLVNIFGGGDYLTTYANVFTRTLADLESQRKSLEAVEKLDFDKIGGRTGLLYKGKGIVEALNKMAAGTDFWLVRDTVVQTIGDAIIQNKNVVEEINKIEFKPVFDVPKLKKDIDKLIAKKVDKNDKVLTSKIKGAFDALMAAGSYGESMEHILSGLGLTTLQKDIIYEIVTDIKTSDYYVDKNDAWDASFAEVLWSIRSNGIKQQQLKKIQELFKNAKESDFVYKPAASMYEFDVPASSKMISAGTKLNKQSPYVQEAIMKFIGDYQGLMPSLRPFVRIDIQRLGELRNFFDLGTINGNFDVAQIKDIQNNMMKSPYYKTHSWHVETALDKLMSIAVEEAVVGSLGRETTIQDIIDEIETYVETYKPGEITSQAMDVEYEDMQTMGKILKDHLLRKYSPDTALQNVASFYEQPTLSNNTGIGFYDTLVKAIERDSEIFDAIKQDESLGLRQNPTAREMASKLLRKYGIAGGRYYGKRDKRGFVTFGRTPMVKRLLQGKQANGFFDPELNVILLGKNWNTMTLPHELAHYWLNTLFNVYKRVQSGELKANAEWVQEKKDMFAMLGIDENQDALTAGQQEKFARMTEAYLTGIGVSKEMNQTFKDFFAWVPEKYKSILQLGYLDDQGKLQYPFLDQKAVDFFNRWYENASLPSLPTSPERQRFMNVTGDDDKVEKVSIKEMNDREKEFAQDAEEQQRTDARLYNTLDENMPSDIKPTADAQKVIINERGNFLTTSEAQQTQVAEEPKRRWFERKSRETEIQKAQEYIEKNPEHAKEVIFGDPELVPNDTGVDRATLINTYMALNNITPDNPDWATLHTNIAINQSLAGTQLALSNDKSYGTYLDALREIENVLELKAATNYAGSKQGARERFNADIQRFLDKELPAIFATEPNSKEREAALKAMFEKARTTFSGNTTGSILNQVDLDYAKGQTKKNEAFMRWAINQIKKDAGAKLNNEQQAKLLQISAKAQQAMKDLDNREAGKAVAAAQELRNWQMEKQALMGVSPQKFSLFGDWAPRAMLASFNTLVVANIPSTAMNTVVVNATKTGLFGKNRVSKDLIDSEVKRIKAIYGATGMNLAQMEKPTSPSLLHGEKYSAAGQKWYDPYVILGKEDNFFRVPTFVNTLAQIASTDAQATNRSADDVFREYASINNQSDEAKLARKQALAVANMAVFTQNGALASCLNHIRSELNKLSRVTFGLEPEGFGLGNLIAPFLTTGANIAEMGIRGSLAPITTITTMVNKWHTGKELDPMKKLALRMDWTYFTLSAVSMVLLAALTSDDDDFYTDPYRTGLKYSPDKPYDSINIAGVWLDLDFFGSFAIPMRTAAKVIQAWKKDNGIGNAVMKGYAESAKSVLGDVPLAESVINNQVNWAVRKPGSWASSYLYTQANKLVPAQIKPVSRALSRGEDWIFEPFAGTTVGRKFNRNYGFDGAELTTQDLIELLTIKVQLDQSLNQKL